ncbi:hypothetical protein [Crassaminicella profunda]|nr:hypothetical protein [Crassaminicella profunda]QZY55374.1 hypothetical protein K7H06_20655 [Crassaminicella profunda]
MNKLVDGLTTLIPSALDDMYSDNHIRLLKFVSYGHFPEPPNQIQIV